MESHPHLTKADFATARAVVERRYTYLDAKSLLRQTSTELHQVNREVENFQRYHDDALWMAAGIDILTGQDFAPNWRNVKSIEELRTKVEAQIASDLQEQVDWFEADADDWRSYHNGDNPTDAEHPWGDAEIVLVRAWLALTPYTIWAMYHDLMRWVQYQVRDIALDMAVYRDDGESIAKYTQKKWNEIVKTWEKAQG